MDSKAKLYYAAYTRKSTEGEDRQMLSHEDQERDLLRIEQVENLNVVERYTGKLRGESKSAHKRGRPIFTKMMQQIEAGHINALLVWHPNRIARNAFDGGWVITMMDEGKLLEVKTANGVYRNTSNDKFMLQLEFNMAKKTSDDNGDAVRRGIKSKLKMGWYPSNAPLGYLNTVNNGKGMNTIVKDPERFDQVKEMWKLMLTGNYTPPQILEIVNNDWKMKSRRGKNLCRSMIYKIFNNSFYSGYFEYPKGSGDWYEGKHEPMVTREEFDRVQVLLGNKERPRPLTRRFAFTGIMECGHCGAAITAEEKIKRQKNGNVHQYVYYRCTKRIDPKCPEKTVELKELTKQVDLVIKGITVSDQFREWALKYLHEVRSEEANAHEEALAVKQKRVRKLTEQIDSLLLRYTSPANISGELISDDEYKSVKNNLLNEKHKLEKDLAEQSISQEKWIELSERTFNFTRYAGVWFLKGDMETRRAIFAALGSNLSLKDRKVSVSLRKPFKLLYDNLEDINRELMLVRTSLDGANKGQIVSFASTCPTVRRVRDSNP